MSARPRPHGFTLVELLIALALTGIVSLLMLSGTRFAALGLDRVAAQADTLEARDNLEALLRREIAAAVASPLAPNAPPFVGGPQSLAFLSLAEDSGAGLYRVDLAVENAALVLRRRRVGAAGAPAADRTILAARLADFRVEYFGATPTDDAPQWHDRWEGLRYPPLLVRITLDTGDGLARPALVVRLWTGAG
jgi:general secretion pathway protein J